jgi:hypothetical protein
VTSTFLNISTTLYPTYIRTLSLIFTTCKARRKSHIRKKIHVHPFLYTPLYHCLCGRGSLVISCARDSLVVSTICSSSLFTDLFSLPQPDRSPSTVPCSLPPEARQPREEALRHCLQIGVKALKSNMARLCHAPPSPSHLSHPVRSIHPFF